MANEFQTDRKYESKSAADYNMSVIRRIWKYKFHYIVVLPALLPLIIFKLIPLLSALRLSFLNYSPFKGIAGSAPVGWKNFINLFSSPYFSRVIRNTLTIKLENLLLISVAALLVSLMLSYIRNKRLANIFTTLFAAPYFIPSVVFGYYIILLLSPSLSPYLTTKGLILVNKDMFRIILILAELLKNFGIPVIVALGAINFSLARLDPDIPYGRSTFTVRLTAALKAVTAFSLIQLSNIFSQDFEFLHALINPNVYETADTVEMYLYRTSLLNMQINTASALWAVQFIVQLILVFILYLMLKKFFSKSLFSTCEEEKPGKKTQMRGTGAEAASIIISTIIGLFILALLYMVYINPFTSRQVSGVKINELFTDISLSSSFIAYIIITLTAVLVNAFITLTLAYPLTVRDLPGHRVYRFFLLTLFSMATPAISEYLMFRSLHMIDTIYPFMIGGFISIINIFVLKEFFNSKYGNAKEELSNSGRSESGLFITLYIPKVWKTLAALSIFQFITIWNSYYYSLVYMANIKHGSPVFLFKVLPSLARSAGQAIEYNDPVFMRFGAIVALPSLILFIAFRKLLTSEAFISRKI